MISAKSKLYLKHWISIELLWFPEGTPKCFNSPHQLSRKSNECFTINIGKPDEHCLVFLCTYKPVNSRYTHPVKKHGTQKWRFGRWFSFSIGWFLGSMVIFRGVSKIFPYPHWRWQQHSTRWAQKPVISGVMGPLRAGFFHPSYFRPFI